MNKEKAQQESFVLIATLILSIAMLPITISILIGRYLVKLKLTFKENKRITFIKLGLIGGTYVILLILALSLSSFSKTNLSWYDYLLPVITEIKLIITLISGEASLEADLVCLGLASVTPSILAFLLILWLRNGIASNYLEAIAFYEKKLSMEEVVSNPKEDFGASKHLLFFIFLQNKTQIEGMGDVKATEEGHIMLDNKYGIPRKYLNRHLAIVGTTGSGKTETLYKFVNDGINHDKPIIFVDGKGEEDNILRFKAMAEAKGVPFKVFSIGGDKDLKSKEIKTKVQTSTYNPFAITNEGILVDMIMSLFDFTEEHYKAGARTFFDILIKTMLELKMKVSWENILLYLDKFKLIELLKERYNISQAKKEPQEAKKGKISISQAIAEEGEGIDGSKSDVKGFKIDLNQINNIDSKALSGFTSRLGMFYNTTRNTITEDGFTLEDIFKENGVVVFSLKSLDYTEQASGIGRLIVNDIKASAETNNSLNKKTLIALDEFNVFANDNVIDILNKTRSKGYEMILAFQSIADLTKVSEDFKNQVIENTNHKIIHKTNDPVGADYLSSVIGTSKRHIKTYVAEEGEGTTGGQSVRVGESYIAHPNDIKNLRIGEAFAKYIDENGNSFAIPHKIKIDISYINEIKKKA